MKLEVKTGDVVQAKKLDNFEHKGVKYYPWGILIKDDKNKTDKGTYYCKEATQDYFTEGKTVTYTYEKNEKEIAKSRILPAVKREESKEAPKSVKQDPPDMYIRGKVADNVSFAASYAKDIMVAMINNGKSTEGLFSPIASEILKWQKEQLNKL
jgi:hypothetical protein